MVPFEYFRDKEMVCRCGCGAKHAQRPVEMLYAVRIQCDFPLIVSSPARCLKHNAIWGNPNSYHLPPEDREDPKYQIQDTAGFDLIAFSAGFHYKYEVRLIEVCLFCGFRGIGFRDNKFLHVDNGLERMWGYK